MMVRHKKVREVGVDEAKHNVVGVGFLISNLAEAKEEKECEWMWQDRKADIVHVFHTFIHIIHSISCISICVRATQLSTLIPGYFCGMKTLIK